MTSTNERFVTPAEVAERLRVSTMTVYRLIEKGDLVAARIGRSYRMRESDVEAYLARQFTQAG